MYGVTVEKDIWKEISKDFMYKEMTGDEDEEWMFVSRGVSMKKRRWMKNRN